MLIKEKNTLLVLQTNEFTTGAKLLLLITFPLAALLFWAAFRIDIPQLHFFQCIPAAFLFYGLTCMIPGRKSYIDRDLKTVQTGTYKIDFSDIGGIQVLPVVEYVKHKVHLKWQINLVKKSYIRYMDKIEDRYTALLAETESPARQEKLQELRDKQADYNEKNSDKNRFLLTCSYSELKIHQTARKLSELFEVPFFDHNDLFIEKREAHELDLSFSQKIKSGTIPAPDDSEQTGMAGVYDKMGKKAFFWKDNSPVLFTVAGIWLTISALFTLAAISTVSVSRILVFLTASAIGALLLLVSLIKRKHFFEIDKSENVLKRRSGISGKWKNKMNLDELITIHVHTKTRPKPIVTLVSHSKIITIKTADIKTALWIYRWMYDNLL